MSENKIKDDNYYLISGWMLNRLGLKGVALQVFAIIYGYSQDGESAFSGSLQYLSDFTGTSKPTVIKALKDLVDAGYLIKMETQMNGIKFCSYKVALPVVKKLNGGSKETLIRGSKEILHNNKSSDNELYKEYLLIEDMYNEICISFPHLCKMSDSRKRALKARLKKYSLEDFRTVFRKAEASSFLKGGNARNWSATFDWMIKDSSMAKILDGNFDDRPSAQSGTTSGATSGTDGQTKKTFSELVAEWGEGR